MNRASFCEHSIYAAIGLENSRSVRIYYQHNLSVPSYGSVPTKRSVDDVDEQRFVASMTSHSCLNLTFAARFTVTEMSLIVIVSRLCIQEICRCIRGLVACG
jgi:hypothetical protein